jgi:hypothetical protein
VPAPTATGLTYEDFLSVDEVFKPKVVYAATPHVKKGKSEDVIDIEATEKVIPAIITECQKMWQSDWDKVEADSKADTKAIVLKCLRSS